jgi:hypothetical protein
MFASFALEYESAGIVSASRTSTGNIHIPTARSAATSVDVSWFDFQPDIPDTLDICGFDTLRMAVPYMLLQMVLSLEDLLLVETRTHWARMALVLMRGAMSEKGVSPCIGLLAKRFRTSPGSMWCPFGVLVQLLEVPEQLVALLANMALLVIFVRAFRFSRRGRTCHAGLLL